LYVLTSAQANFSATFHAWVHDGFGLRQDVGCLMMVGDNHIHAEFGGKLGLADRRDAAVDGYD